MKIFTEEAKKRIVVAGVVRDILVERSKTKKELGVFTFTSDKRNTSPCCFKIHEVKMSFLSKGPAPKGPELAKMTIDLEEKLAVVELGKAMKQYGGNEKLDRFGRQSREEISVDLKGWIIQTN